jgi:hypothetical protein
LKTVNRPACQEQEAALQNQAMGRPRVHESPHGKQFVTTRRGWA